MSLSYCTYFVSFILVGLLFRLVGKYLITTSGSHNYPPGPIRIPVLGLMPFLAANPQNVLKWLGRLYGSVFTIFIGGYRVVVLNDCGAVKDAFKEDIFCGRPDLKMLEVRNGSVRKGLVCSEGKEWAEQRRFTMRHLKDFGFGKRNMEALIQEEVDELLDGIRKETEKPITLPPRFNMAVLNALWRITTGERYGHGDVNLQKLIENTGADLSETQYTGPILFLPWLIKVAPGLTRWNKFVDSVDSVHKYLKGMIDQHKETIDYDNIRDFIDAYLLEIQKTTDPNSSFYGEVGEHSLLVVLLDLFMAGADTQSTTLSWALLYMVLHQRVQIKVQQEIDYQIGNGKPSFEHRKLMPYTEATIMEILRKSSLVPMGLFHSTTGNTKFRNFYIPKDTVILGNLYNVLNDESYWGDPEVFRPERFLDQDNQIIKHEGFLPFSTGKRSCPGENLARDQLFLILVRLLQEFTFIPISNKGLPTDTPKVGVILSPQPYQVMAINRILPKPTYLPKLILEEPGHFM